MVREKADLFPKNFCSCQVDEEKLLADLGRGTGQLHQNLELHESLAVKDFAVFSTNPASSMLAQFRFSDAIALGRGIKPELKI